MSGTMSQADLVADLKAVLQDAANKFTAAADADFARHLDIAALDLGRVRPRTLLGTVTLAADQPNYTPPADLLRHKLSLWGTAERRQRKPWDTTWPGPLPRVSVVETGSGRELYLEPAPTAAQIANLGSAYKFFYFSGHVIGVTANETSVQPGDRALLLIRAAAQALMELAHDGVSKPVKLGSSGVGSMPKNGTPAALAEQLMKLFEEMAW